MSRLSLYCVSGVYNGKVLSCGCFAVCFTSMKTCISVIRAICDVTLWNLWASVGVRHHEGWCVVPWHPSSYLSISYSTVVRNCASNSSIYCACLQKTFFLLFYTHSPRYGVGQYDIAQPWQSDNTGNMVSSNAGPTSQNLFAYSLWERWLLFPSVLKPFLTQSRGAANRHSPPRPAPPLGKPSSKTRRTTPTPWSCDWPRGIGNVQMDE